MSDYTPTTREVRAAFGAIFIEARREQAYAEFDRWLAEYTAEKRAEWEAERETEPSEQVNAALEFLRVAINQQGIDNMVGLADWELVELIAQAPCFGLTDPESED
ncbi:hypothetical protein PTQ19_07090 [Microbacterium esteraromaticum]|uniref:hypothetical protein n=1 Tax=Microbacterium esteraromaticum TaxID=57043 RepID=UPI002367A3B5|nr:hypothetical protein [Microbacterium esteraromaticum]WDH80188.1 hypothetical protein PTQ19_07090 [Microbacterium esteraromaticum]